MAYLTQSPSTAARCRRYSGDDGSVGECDGSRRPQGDSIEDRKTADWSGQGGTVIDQAWCKFIER